MRSAASSNCISAPATTTTSGSRRTRSANCVDPTRCRSRTSSRNAPRISGTTSGDWDAWSTPSVGLRLHFDLSFAARQYLALPQQQAISQPTYALLNLRADLHSPSDRWNLGLWSNNVNDEFHLTNAVDLQDLGYDYRHRGVTRTFGMDVAYKF